MSRQLEQEHEDRQASKNMRLAHALDYGLEELIRSEGGDLRGFTVKTEPGDCFIVLKAKFGAGMQVSFVWSDTVTNCVLKCVKMAKNGRLGWREDRFDNE